MNTTESDMLTRAAERLEDAVASAPSGRTDVQEFAGVSPAVAAPLAKWLRDASFVALVTGGPLSVMTKHALAFARALLAEGDSEGQPAPAVWHRGDAPGPLRYSVVNVARLVVIEQFAATTFVMSKLGMSHAAAEAALSCLETWGVVEATGRGSHRVADIPVEQLADLVAALSEVADQ